MCHVVKENYGDDKGGFIGGQVYKNAGFVSKEGSLDNDESDNKKINQNMGDIVIVTYWNSFDQHEKSHADELFNKHFSKLGDFCDATFEVGYEMLWQGVPEDD